MQLTPPLFFQSTSSEISFSQVSLRENKTFVNLLSYEIDCAFFLSLSKPTHTKLEKYFIIVFQCSILFIPALYSHMYQATFMSLSPVVVLLCCSCRTFTSLLSETILAIVLTIFFIDARVAVLIALVLFDCKGVLLDSCIFQNITLLYLPEEKKLHCCKLIHIQIKSINKEKHFVKG